MSIRNRILEYMQKGHTLTALECHQRFGTLRLGAYIHILKKEGYTITSETVKGKNRYGDKIQWCKYKLVQKEEQAWTNTETKK